MSKIKILPKEFFKKSLGIFEFEFSNHKITHFYTKEFLLASFLWARRHTKAEPIYVRRSWYIREKQYYQTMDVFHETSPSFLISTFDFSTWIEMRRGTLFHFSTYFLNFYLFSWNNRQIFFCDNKQWQRISTVSQILSNILFTQ